MVLDDESVYNRFFYELEEKGVFMVGGIETLEFLLERGFDPRSGDAGGFRLSLFLISMFCLSS